MAGIRVGDGDQMVSALDYRSTGPGLIPGRGRCVVFLADTLLSYCPSPPKCINGYRRNNAGGLPCYGLLSHPARSRNTPSCFTLQKPG